MRDNNEEVSLIDVVVAQQTIVYKNELILQLMQQIAEMRVEMQKRQDILPQGFDVNGADGRPPIYFLSSNIDQAQNQPSTLAQNLSVIYLLPKIPNMLSLTY